MRLKEIADKLGVRLDSADHDLEITGVAPIESASAGHISFIANPKYAPFAKTTGASALIVDDRFAAVAKPLLRT
ncbi:MAG TPA: LpxD N-terminal domain-containing protein, partial [Candidatus Angelobacter sp.]|nr:LpxD N-terminal domain-containing protein [Candidatus Angelobacter sp.]